MIGRLALAGALACGGCGGAADAEAPGIADAATGGVRADRVVLTGVLHAASAADIVSPSTGQMLAIRWLAADGAVVVAGDPVLALDPTLFATKLVDSRTALRQAEQQLHLLHDAGALELAGKQLAVRRQQIVRDKAVEQAGLPGDLLPARTVDRNQRARVRAEAQLHVAERELATATSEQALEQQIKQLELDKLRRTIRAAEQAIGELVIRAPRDGVVIIEDSAWDARKFHAGQTVSDGTLVATLPDFTRPMEVRAELCDVDDGRIQRGMAGRCTLDAYPAAPIACTVEDLAPIARGHEGDDSLRRTFAVTLALAHGDPARARPGMAVKVELPAASIGGAR